ncbi:MAG: AbrB/MazE/SpoVT family DNA-binding domain-containing protein [Caldilineaceae bacterium]
MIIINSMITTVTGKNQITIPAKIVRALDIQPGTRIDWSIGKDGSLIAQVVPQRGILARQITGMGRAWLDADSDPIDELLQERGKEDLEEGLL